MVRPASSLRPWTVSRRRTRVRWAVVAVATLIALAVLIDFGSATAAEYRLSRTIRAAGGFDTDPDVTIDGFPFITAARDGRYRRVSIAVPSVPLGGGRVAQLEAELQGVTLPIGTRLVTARTPLRAESIDARVRLDQKDFGRYLGIIDVQVHTPVPGRHAGAGSPADGLVKSATGVILTGKVPLPTPQDPSRTVTVSVSCDFSAVDGGIAVRATRIYTGPEDHATAKLLPGDEPRVLAAFSRTLPPMRLPFGLTASGAEGENADVVLFGSARDATVTPGAFYRVGT